MGNPAADRCRPASAASGSSPAARVFSIPRSYASWITVQIIVYFCLIACLVEGIFLSEHFIDIFEQTVDETASLADVLLLLGLTAPEVHFALPVAILAAVYFVMLRCRERRELVVLAGSGLGRRELVVLATVLGIATLAASLAITGIALPHASFAFRRALVAVRNDAIRTGGAAGHFYTFPGYTVYKWPRTAPTGYPGLFIYQTRDDGVDRAISVDGAQVMASSQPGALYFRLHDVMAVDIPDPNTPLGNADEANGPQAHPIGCTNCARGAGRTMRSENYVQTLDLSQLMRLEPRGIVPAEWTSAELLGFSPPPAGAAPTSAERRELTGRLVRGLLCLTAPFVALAALGLTTRLTQAFALPAACGLVLCLDVAGLALCRMLDRAGLAPALLGVTVMFVCLIAVLIWQIGVRHLAIVKPGFAKT